MLPAPLAWSMTGDRAPRNGMPADRTTGEWPATSHGRRDTRGPPSSPRASPGHKCVRAQIVLPYQRLTAVAATFETAGASFCHRVVFVVPSFRLSRSALWPSGACWRLPASGARSRCASPRRCVACRRRPPPGAPSPLCIVRRGAGVSGGRGGVAVLVQGRHRLPWDPTPRDTCGWPARGHSRAAPGHTIGHRLAGRSRISRHGLISGCRAHRT